jgi:hypothetical protein
MNWSALGIAAANDYLGIAADPGQMQGMNAAQLAEYMRRQGDPTNVPWPGRSLAGMQTAWGIAERRPTMTLAEYDARRDAFKPRSDHPPAL